LKATTAYDRYYIPLALVPLFCFLLIASRSMTSGSPRPGSHRVFTPALTVLVLVMGGALIQRQIAVHAPDDLVDALKAFPNLPPGSKVYLPEEAAVTYVVRLPQSEYRRIRRHTEQELAEGTGVRSFLAENGVPQAAVGVWGLIFNETERTNALQTALAAEAESPPSNWDIFLYRTNMSNVRTSWADLSLTEAVESFRGNDPVALLVEESRPELGKPVWRGHEWSWYTNQRLAALEH
jgi:hypothetical protein